MVEGLECLKATQEKRNVRIRCTKVGIGECLCQLYSSCTGKFILSEASKICKHQDDGKQVETKQTKKKAAKTNIFKRFLNGLKTFWNSCFD